MKVIRVIDNVDILNITERVRYRQERYDEELQWSIGVVLMNYGDPHIRVYCINQEWEGRKADLPPRDGIPLCPNGHPLLETTRAPKLALIEEG